MDVFEELLISYQNNISKGEYYYRSEQNKKALEFFNTAAMDLYNAKEFAISNKVIRDAAEESKEFRVWLVNKLQSIEESFSKLTEFAKSLQQNIDCPETPQTPRKSQRPRKSREKNKRPNKKYSRRSRQSFQNTRSPQKTPEMSRKSPPTPRAPRKPRRRDSEKRNRWTNVAENSINLLCHLRSKYDFEDREKDFEHIIRERRNLHNITR